MKKKWWVIGGLMLATALFVVGGQRMLGKQGEEKRGENIVSPTPHPFANYRPPKVRIEVARSQDSGQIVIEEIPADFEKLEYDVIYKVRYQDELLEKGVTSGNAIPVKEGKVARELVFGTRSCNPQGCSFSRDVLSLDYPVQVVLKLYDSQERIWEVRKEIKIKESGGVLRGEG